MARSNSGYIGPYILPSDISAVSGIHSLAAQQQLQGSSRWNSVYENLSTSLSLTGNLTATYANPTSVSIFKTSGGSAWDNSARGTVGYTAPCTIEFNKLADAGDNSVSYAMIGWNEDPTANNSYDTLDYAAYPYATSSYSVYHNGTNISPLVSSWSTAQKWYVVYTTAGHIKHYNGSTLMYNQTGYGAGKTVYFDTSFYAVNAVYGGFSNIRILRKEWNGTAYI